MKLFLRTTFIFLFIAFSQVITVQAQGIQFFKGSWEDLQAEAKKENKPIFVDCFTSWCGPCKMLATRVFTQKQVGDFFNSHFVCYSMDMEKGEGPQMARFFNVRFYPTLLFLAPEGGLMHRTSGAVPADVLLEQARMALDPQNCLAGRIRRFYAGEKDTTFLIELAILIRNIDDKIQNDALGAYWTQIPDSMKYSSTNWQRFKQLDNNVNSIEFQFIERNKPKFETLYGVHDVNQTLFDKAAYSMQHAAETKDESMMKNAKAVLDSSHQQDIMKFAALGEMIFYKSVSDFKKFHTLAIAYVDTYAKNDADELNNVAYEASNGNDDPDLLKDAEKWVKQSISIKKAYANMDTYAHILYKLGKKKEAEATALEAIGLAQKEGADDRSTRELLQQMKTN